MMTRAGEELATSLEEMAADYLRQIRTVRSHGPYHLLGWSFDVWPVGAASKHHPLPIEEELDRALMEILVKSSGMERIPNGQKPFTASALELLRCEGSPLQGLDDRAISALRKVMANDTKLGYTHLPGQFDGDLVFFTAGAAEPTKQSAAQDSWRPFVAGRITNHVIACTHDDMLRTELAADIARIIETELKGTRER